ncbi:response regulator transcription factor [Candidatus Saccharibacteria bacterium]|nr:response regulator transcription factor [Candidatus Saccharibacteria bacterium]
MRLLVIEDEQKIARSLKRALETEHYAVDVAYDGDEGYAMASSEEYDGLIVDRMLPGSKDGLAIVYELRKNSIFTPVLFLTALGAVHERTKGLDSGADDYLVKPFALDEFLARVRALVRRPPQQLRTTLTANDLELDTVAQTVKRSGTNIALTAKEFSLLEYLLRNKGLVLSKDQLTAHVWDFDADILPNTVEAHIKQLRRKIDKPFSSQLIRTVRGFGYKIEG